MKKTKKLVALVLVAVLAITTVVGTTLAYFTDTEQRHNTMVVGNVDIDIDELTYDAKTGEWADFEDDKFVLYPMTKQQRMTSYNKMVYTFNNSENGEAAYIRSWILCEVVTDANGEKVDKIAFAYSDKVEQSGVIYDVVVDGVTYDAYAFTAKDKQPIAPGAYLDSLSCVGFTEDTTQEQAALYNGRLDMIAFSEAVQSTGVADHAAAMAILDNELDAETLAARIEGAPGAHINNHFDY